MKRRAAREKALQALFQIDISGSEPSEALSFVLREEENDLFLSQLIEGTIKHLKEIDEKIIASLENWSLDRLGKVDVNVLRISIYELLYSEEAVPKNVVMNEAIEIAKKYGDEKSGKFINGILSKINSEEKK